MIQISCENASIFYDNIVAVDAISFDVASGDYICIVGENGSGKSTLIKALLGLVPLKAGKITFSGDVSRNKMGYLPQQTIVQRDFPASVSEVVLSGCLNKGGLKPFYSKADKSLAHMNMKEMGVYEIKHKSYRELSGGQQQRVLLARALCATDKMLILDEPATGLDPLVRQEFYEIIQKLNRERGVSVIMVSHDIDTAVKNAQKILHINQSAQFWGDVSSYVSSEFGKRFLGGDAS